MPFCVKNFLKDYGSGTNQMGGFVGETSFLQIPNSWTWWILYETSTPLVWIGQRRSRQSTEYYFSWAWRCSFTSSFTHL